MDALGPHANGHGTRGHQRNALVVVGLTMPVLVHRHEDL